MSAPQKPESVCFGWAAPSFAEQFPDLPADIAGHLDKDNQAIIRLSSRGLLTERERDAAIRRAKKTILIELTKVRSNAG